MSNLETSLDAGTPTTEAVIITKIQDAEDLGDNNNRHQELFQEIQAEVADPQRREALLELMRQKMINGRR